MSYFGSGSVQRTSMCCDAIIGKMSLRWFSAKAMWSRMALIAIDSDDRTTSNIQQCRMRSLAPCLLVVGVTVCTVKPQSAYVSRWGAKASARTGRKVTLEELERRLVFRVVTHKDVPMCTLCRTGQ